MAIEYGGSADGAPNPGVVDGSGDATLGGMIGGLFGGLSTAVQEALNIISGLVGIPAAQASNYSVVNSLGQSVGYLTLTGIQGLTLGQALAQSAAAIDISSGLVLDRNGVKAGFVDLESVGTGNLTVGPINIDEVTQTISTNTPAGVGITAQVPAALALQLNSIDGVALRQTTRYWRPTTCSTLGVPILDYNNTAALFSSPPRQAFMHPAFIGGLDGIYSLHTGQRVVPPADVGGRQLGFSVGDGASYAKANVAMGWTSAGRAFVWGYYGGDVFRVLDPTTNAIPDIVAYAQLKVWNGSQQISTDGYSWDYPVVPSASNPIFNTAVHGKVAYSNVALNTAFVTYQAGSNPGGPDGGASR